DNPTVGARGLPQGGASLLPLQGEGRGGDGVQPHRADPSPAQGNDPSDSDSKRCGATASLTNTETSHATDPAPARDQPRQPWRQGRRQAGLWPQLPRAPG